MRVLLGSHRFPPDGTTGVERITEGLATELRARGDEVAIVCARPAGAFERIPLRERLPNGATVYRCLVGDIESHRFLSEHELLERAFARILTEFDPEVAHFMHLLDLSPRFVTMAQDLGAAVVLSLQDFYLVCAEVRLRKTSGELCAGPNGGRECAATCFAAQAQALPRWSLRTAYFRRLLDLADGLIAPSAYVADYFRGLGVDAARLRTVANPISVPGAAPERTEHPSPREPGRLVVAFLGTVLPFKGLHVLLEALHLARIPAVELNAFGPVPNLVYLEELRSAARRIPGLELRFFGSYDPACLPALLADTDCTVVPSIWPETFAIVARESFRCGVPILVSRLGGLPEAVRE
ncbi:MAG: glycosyltransferase, partial [Candidatus Binatia bacterium]